MYVVLESRAEPPAEAVADATLNDIAALHEHCGVYTKPSTAARILNEIGWTDSQSLSEQRLLEPAAGDGVFLVEAARRLLISLSRGGVRPGIEQLAPRIQAFELHAGEGERGRAKLKALLSEFGINADEARRIAEHWLVIGDFLLQDLARESFTHVTGNPPYARWSKIPERLRRAYEAKLPPSVAKGDIFLPFLDRGIDALRPGGRLGFLCSDRWEFMAFAEGFRAERLPFVRIVKNDEVRAEDCYQRSVHIYPSILVLEKLARRTVTFSSPRKGLSLEEMGFEIRVGPALGCTPAYVLSPADAARVEPELLAPWINSSDIREGAIADNGLRVICLYDEKGRLRDLDHYPRAKEWLSAFKDRLEARSIVKQQRAIWYRPIDRVYAAAWAAPKLLIPELSKRPRIALDHSGAVPSHGVYAILGKGSEANLSNLYEKLAGGELARLLEGKAPKVKGEYWRCYKSILKELRL